MFSRRPTKIFASASFRLTMAYAAVFVVVTLTVIFAGGAAAMAIFRAELKDEVAEELRALAAEAAQGRETLLNALAARAAKTGETGLSYQLAGPSGEALFGDLGLSRFESDWFEFVPVGEDDEEEWLGRAERLPDGSWLAVVSDLEQVHDTWELMVAGTGWTLAISLPLALLCGAMMSAMVLRRIEAIDATAARIRDGGLHERAPLRGSGDEFDRLTANINAMLDSIEALTRNIRDVSSGIAHDLRTPLTRVSNRLESLQERRPAGAELESEIEAVKSEISTLLVTFDALLRIGEIEAGTRRAGFRTLDFSALSGELAETYEVMAAESGKRLSSQIAPGVQLQGDRALLVQMIANVLENAIVHTASGTEISLSLSPATDGARLVIADTGPGIPEAERQRVFTRFYRGDRSRRTNGNGLGMNIVRSIAGLHGIKVTLADNAPGLRVEFLVPRESLR
ncbi:sensor histidine kinase [Pelagibius marinus]|uniref:sensor histidine kinase n=1 Tax=Pelagibius marinus TaxID=2762760 RepID=UPI001872513D|nr:HAMP domain-containing sensor histidine kinase [Pelagibius marinus]